jgi:hypothetical protein
MSLPEGSTEPCVALVLDASDTILYIVPMSTGFIYEGG